MVDAGAEKRTSGENAIRISVACADYIIGPIGIALPNAMMGEITPGMAEAVHSARGKKLLLPLSRTHEVIVCMARSSETITDALFAAFSIFLTGYLG